MSGEEFVFAQILASMFIVLGVMTILAIFSYTVIRHYKFKEVLYPTIGVIGVGVLYLFYGVYITHECLSYVP